MSMHTRRRAWRQLALPLAAVALTAFAACGGDDDTEATTAPIATAATTATSAATRAPEGSPSAVASASAPAPAAIGSATAARRTSDAKINAVLDAIEKKDAAALAALTQPVTTPCTTVAGAGGPPKCDQGVANNTPVTKFPALTCELSFIGTDQIQSYFASGPLGAANVNLYAVASVKDPGMLAYNPQGDYIVVIETSAATGPATGSMFNVSKDGRVVNYWSGCGAGAAQIMAAQGGTNVLLAPPAP